MQRFKMWELEREMVLDTAQRMSEKGLVIGTMGNVSMRLKSGSGKELMAITPSSCYYDMLVPDDIVIDSFWVPYPVGVHNIL